MIDPVSAGELGRLPKDEEGFGNHGNSEYMLAYDNVSGVSPLQSDVLCVLATGGGLKVRKLYTDNGQIIFDNIRPCVLNGIPDFAERTDLADRCLSVFQRRLESGRTDERTLWTKFEDIRGQVFGAILDKLSEGLRNLDSTVLDELPRMADACRWVTACTGTMVFVEAYKANRDESLKHSLDSSPVSPLLRSMLDGVNPHYLVREKGYWKGTASELLDELKSWANHTGWTLLKTFPETPRGLAGQIRRDAMALRTVGVSVSFGTSKGQNIMKFSPIITPESHNPKKDELAEDEVPEQGQDDPENPSKEGPMYTEPEKDDELMDEKSATIPLKMSSKIEMIIGRLEALPDDTPEKVERLAKLYKLKEAG